MSTQTSESTDVTGFPAFTGEPHYVEGYLPSSYDSPHSPLSHASTWIGMGAILSSVVGIGTWVFGFASHQVHSQEHWAVFAVIGLVFMLTCWIGAFLLIYYGRRDQRAYVRRTGRNH